MQKYQLALLFFFLFLFISTPAFALNINPSEETYVSMEYPAANYSGQCTNVIKTDPTEWTFSYFKFNISGIPANATIINAYISMWQTYARTGTNRTVEAYNTTNNWTTYNITWNAKHDVSVLQSSTGGVNYTQGSITVGRKNFTVTNAVKAAYAGGVGTVSIALRDSVNSSATAAWADFGRARCYEPNHDFLVVEYNITDCSSSCGTCGCDAAGTDCYVPPITGSYCDIDDGLPNSIKTVYSNCTNTVYDCPSGQSCTQVTPVFNFSNITNAGQILENPAWVPANQAQFCNGCWFINAPLPCPGNPLTTCWTAVASNCFDSLIPLKFRTECDCNAAACSANIYNTSTTTFNNTIEQWSAGCWDGAQQKYSIIINATGVNTTLDNMVKEACADCNLTNIVPTQYCTKINTSTTCYDAACNPVACSIVVPPATCSSNYGGQLALVVGGLMGITDCGLSQTLIAMIVSIAVGFALLFYTRNDGHGGQAFIFGTLITLVMFTVVGWFYSWLMVIIIVIGGYIVAKQLGIGGG